MRVMIEDDTNPGDTEDTRRHPRVLSVTAQENEREVVSPWSKRRYKRKPRLRHVDVKAHPNGFGVYSRRDQLWELDERTREAQFMRSIREELTAHVGGHPSVTERLLIERCVMLSLKCAQIDARILAGEPFTDHDHRHGLAWMNALRRSLLELGLQPHAPEAKASDLSDWIINRSRSQVG